MKNYLKSILAFMDILSSTEQTIPNQSNQPNLSFVSEHTEPYVKRSHKEEKKRKNRRRMIKRSKRENRK